MADLVIALMILGGFALLDWAVWAEACLIASYRTGRGDWRRSLSFWLKGPGIAARLVPMLAAAVCFIVAALVEGADSAWAGLGLLFGLLYAVAAWHIFHRNLRALHHSLR